MSRRSVNLLRKIKGDFDVSAATLKTSGGLKLAVEAITGNTTLVAADSGKLFTIGSATAAVTLPTVAAAGAGWFCEFWVNDETAAVTITSPGTDLIMGYVATGEDNTARQLQPATAIETEVLTFTTSVVMGDHARLWCDGTNYFVEGASQVTDAITLAAE